MFIRPQPYTCLGIELVDPRGSGLLFFMFIRPMIRPQPDPTPVWELNVKGSCLDPHVQILTPDPFTYMFYFLQHAIMRRLT